MKCPVCIKFEKWQEVGELIDGKCNICSYKDYKKITDLKVEALGQKKRQEILDLLKKEHLNIGQICERMSLETMVVSKIVVDNIKNINYLSDVAK
jgi:predicted transcriptional regulator